MSSSSSKSKPKPRSVTRKRMRRRAPTPVGYIASDAGDTRRLLEAVALDDEETRARRLDEIARARRAEAERLVEKLLLERA